MALPSTQHPHIPPSQGRYTNAVWAVIRFGAAVPYGVVMRYATDRRTEDRDESCICGCLASWPLDDGAEECPRCGRVQKSRWQVAHE